MLAAFKTSLHAQVRVQLSQLVPNRVNDEANCISGDKAAKLPERHLGAEVFVDDSEVRTSRVLDGTKYPFVASINIFRTLVKQLKK